MSTPNINKSLSDIFEIDVSQAESPIDDLRIEAKSASIDSLEAQREYVKKNLVSLIEKGIKALNSVITIAESTEVAKDFVVVSDMIKTLVDTNMTLLESEVVHKKINDVPAIGQTTNNTAVFVGSTSDLSKYIKNSAVTSIINTDAN
jgi:hypothetical protein